MRKIGLLGALLFCLLLSPAWSEDTLPTFMHPVTYETMDTLVFNALQPTLVMFLQSKDCDPCLAQYPLLEKANTEFGSQMQFVYIDVDQYPEIADDNGITEVPTFFFVNPDKKTMIYHTGFLDEKTQHQFIEDGLAGKVDNEDGTPTEPDQ